MRLHDRRSARPARGPSRCALLFCLSILPAQASVADLCDATCASDLVDPPIPGVDAAVFEGAAIPAAFTASAPIAGAISSSLDVSAGGSKFGLAVVDRRVAARVTAEYAWIDGDGEDRITIADAAITGAVDEELAFVLAPFAEAGSLERVTLSATASLGVRVVLENLLLEPQWIGITIDELEVACTLEAAPPIALRPVALPPDAMFDADLAAPCGELGPLESCSRRFEFGDCTLDLDGLVPDLDGDGLVGFADLVVVLTSYGAACPPGDPCAGDVDGDGIVGFGDLTALLLQWGPCGG